MSSDEDADLPEWLEDLVRDGVLTYPEALDLAASERREWTRDQEA